MTSLFRRLKGGDSNRTSDDRGSDEDLAATGEVVKDGSLRYVGAKAANDSPVSYQEASGAPVEAVSPLGLDVGNVTIIFLNLSKMVGTGIFSTRRFSRRHSIRQANLIFIHSLIHI
jgi:hypothetical protein